MKFFEKDLTMHIRSSINISLLAAFVFFFLSCTAQHDSENITRNFDVLPFNKLSVETVGKVIYEQTDEVYLIAEGNREIIEKLEVGIEDGYLTISWPKGVTINNKNNIDFIVRIGSPELNSIRHRGVGKVLIKDDFMASTLNITQESVGKLVIENCKLDSLTLNFNAVGSCEIKGNTHYTYIEADGVGNINCSDLKSQITKIKSDGVGNISVYAGLELDVLSGGIGNITYSGNPERVQTKVTGVGKIKHKD